MSDIQLLDIIGIPSKNILFSPLNNNLVYSFGSNLISYNLNTNTKTFFQLISNNEIINFQFIEDTEKILLTIDGSSSLKIDIWSLITFENIFSHEITPKIKLNISNIFIEKFRNNFFLILITSKDPLYNSLYIFYLLNNKYNIDLFCDLFNSENKFDNITGLKVFYNSDKFIVLTKNNIEYYSMNFDQKNCTLIKKINFIFDLLPNSLSLSKNYNIFSFISVNKGSCLIYDQNALNKAIINPVNLNNFSTSFFDDKNNSLCLGSNNGTVFIYSISDYKLKYLIGCNEIYFIKKQFQLNFSDNQLQRQKETFLDIGGEIEGPAINYLFINESTDKMFLRMNDNSILLSPITKIIKNKNGYLNYNSVGNSPMLYSFSHINKINDIDENNFEKNSKQLIFYTISNDIEHNIIKYYFSYENEKIYNQFYKIENNNQFFFTKMKIHPRVNNYLYLGDNKGTLHLYDVEQSYFKFHKTIFQAYEIVNIDFSKEGSMLCIGLETGMQNIYTLDNIKNNKFENNISLTNHYLSPEEIEFRKKNNHILSFIYFFKTKKFKDVIIYLKNEYCIECSKIIPSTENNNYRLQILYHTNTKNKILDVKIHKGENYILILCDNFNIIINDTITNKIVGIIDLSAQVNNVYFMETDYCGLYLAVLCKLKKNETKNYQKDMVIFEIGTGKVQSFIPCIGEIVKFKFDKMGKFIIAGGMRGEISIWKLNDDMIESIYNVNNAINKKENFWEEYRISYVTSLNNINISTTKFYDNEHDQNSLLHQKINNTIVNTQSNDTKNNNINSSFSFNNYSFENKNQVNTNAIKAPFFLFSTIPKEKEKENKNKQTSRNKSQNVKDKILSQKSKRYSDKLSYIKYEQTPNNNLFSLTNRNLSCNNRVFRENGTNLKLGYINILNKDANLENKRKLKNIIDGKHSNKMKDLDKAINILMEDEEDKKTNNIEKDKSISDYTLRNDHSSINSSNKIEIYDENNSSIIDSLDISKDLIYINNKKVKYDKKINNNSNILFLRNTNNKKYPEPSDIDLCDNENTTSLSKSKTSSIYN